MEDPDWIEVAFLFEQEPAVEMYESLLTTAPQISGPEYGAEEFQISYQRPGDHATQMEHVDLPTVIEIMPSTEYCSVEIPMEGFNLNVGFDHTGKSLLSMASMPYLRLSTTIYNFRERQTTENPSEDVLKNRRDWVETLSNAADIFEPHWGFGRRIGIAIGDHETIDELATRTRPPLYEYNVFRNETVEEIGRDAVLSAPAWYTEELSSGAVFMAVTEPPKQCGHEDQLCDEVADQLGLSLATPDRYY